MIDSRHLISSSSTSSSLHSVGDVYWEIVERGRGVPVVVVIISGGELGVKRVTREDE